MSWTDERVATLKSLLAKGKSASEIAKELGDVTRNAVIGKIHRMGLNNKGEEEATSDDGAPKEASASEAEPVSDDEATKAEAPPSKASANAKSGAIAAKARQGDAKVQKKGDKEAETTKPEVAAMVASEDPPPFDSEEMSRPPAAGEARQGSLPGRPPAMGHDEISPEARENAARVESQSKQLSLMQLTERTCKWPIGDPATEDFWFCGHPSQAGKPYCEVHVELAFQAPMSRRDRRH